MDSIGILIGFLILAGLIAIYRKLKKINDDANEWAVSLHEDLEKQTSWLQEIANKIKS